VRRLLQQDLVLHNVHHQTALQLPLPAQRWHNAVIAISACGWGAGDVAGRRKEMWRIRQTDPCVTTAGCQEVAESADAVYGSHSLLRPLQDWQHYTVSLQLLKP
jgi:hypothetical protein